MAERASERVFEKPGVWPMLIFPNDKTAAAAKTMLADFCAMVFYFLEARFKFSLLRSLSTEVL